MPEIKFKSDWLKANDNVHHGDNVRFLDTGHQDKDGNWIFLVGVIPMGQSGIVEQKKFQLNKRNFDATAKLYGTNSDNWVHKEMKIKVVTVENPRTGEEVQGIRFVNPAAAGEAEVDELNF